MFSLHVFCDLYINPRCQSKFRETQCVAEWPEEQPWCFHFFCSLFFIANKIIKTLHNWSRQVLLYCCLLQYWTTHLKLQSVDMTRSYIHFELQSHRWCKRSSDMGAASSDGESKQTTPAELMYLLMALTGAKAHVLPSSVLQFYWLTFIWKRLPCYHLSFIFFPYSFIHLFSTHLSLFLPFPHSLSFPRSLASGIMLRLSS